MDCSTPQFVISSDHEDQKSDISVDSTASKAPSPVSSSNCDEYLKIASDQSTTILLELDMNGRVRYLSKIWEKIVGTKCRSIIERPIFDVILGTDQDKSVFQRALDMMIRDDNSYRVRFIVETNDITSDISSEEDERAVNSQDSSSPGSVETKHCGPLSTNGEVIELEAQGILLHDNFTNLPSHSMWIVKPLCEIDELDNLPLDFVQRLGFGASIFSQYLAEIEDEMILDEQHLPNPKNELCRVCESLVPAWWLETHSELCIFEHKIESAAQILHDELIEQKHLIEEITSSIESNNGRITHYKGLPLPQLVENFKAGQSSSTSPSSSSSESSNPFKTLPQPRKNSNSIFQSLRFPFKSLALLEELCDDAININVSELKCNPEDGSYQPPRDDAIYSFSPRSQQNIEQVRNWHTRFEVSDPAISLLTTDTLDLAKKKVETLIRLDNAMKYSFKIKNEVDNYVLQLIKEKLESNAMNLAHALESSSQVQRTPEKGSRVSTSLGATASRIASPLPKRAQSGIFADSYIGTDTIPAPPPANADEDTAIANASESTSRSFSRSITPRQRFEGSPILPDTTAAGRTSNSSPSVGTPKCIGTGGGSLPKLSATGGLTPRKGSPLSSIGFNTPLSSVQKNSTSKQPLSALEKSPMTSPFAISSDYLTPELHSNASIPRQPLSPLLLATNQAKAPAPSIKDYDIIKPISKGAYGSVYLAKRRLTGEYFAIKVLKKSDMIAKNQVTNVKSERAIMMVQSNKSYVAKLYATFQNKGNLFLVMEYLSGGDLAILLKMMGHLPDQWAKQYISEVIYGVDDMHSNGIIHHDLKPDNLLIDAEGHVKLTDFGLSRMGLVRRHKGTSSKSKFLSSRHNSVTSDDMNSANSLKWNSKTDSPTLNLSLEPPLKKTERSSSSSSFQSSLEIPALHRSGSQVSFSMMDVSRSGTPPPASFHKRNSSSISEFLDGSSTPDYALFNPDDSKSGKKFFGTPDYLAPETIEGTGETNASDWWSVGCILFEFLLGYPPFHANTPEGVFGNILSGKIDWPTFPDEETEREYLPEDAKDLISKLLVVDPDERLGANGAEEIRNHAYFKGVDWVHLYEEKASFVPAVEHPESTDYFDLRGAVLEDFSDSDEEQPHVSGILNPGGEEITRRLTNNHSSESSTPVQRLTIASVLESASQESNSNNGSPTTRHIPLAIPPHLRERRVSKLNEFQTEFGSFNFRNLPALDKANKDAINRLKSEHLAEQVHHLQRSSTGSLSSSSSDVSNKLRSGRSFNGGGSPSSLAGRGLKGSHSPGSKHQSPCRKNSLDSGTLSRRNTGENSPLTPSSALEEGDSPNILSKFRSPLSPQAITTRIGKHSRTSSMRSSGGELSVDEEERMNALSKVNSIKSRRKSGRKSSSGLSEMSYALDILVCEPIPIHRYKLVKDLESLGCSIISVGAGDEMVRRATSGVKFDMIFTALKLPKLGAIDIVKLLRHTNSLNSNTPIVAVTAFYQEAQNAGVFDEVLERPVAIDHLREVLLRYTIKKSQENDEPLSSDTDTESAFAKIS